MHAVIVGCGRVGAELARVLEGRGYTVSIIDKDPNAFEQRVLPGFSGKKLVGMGFDQEILEEAGIQQAQIFASVTRGDNSNIVSARIAKEHYNVPKVAALIYDPRRAQMYERLGIATVATVAWATDQILARVLPSAKSVEWTIGSGEVVVIGFPAPPAFIGRPVEDLRDPAKARVVALTRFGDTQIPDLKTIIQEGDMIHLAVARSALPEMEERLGFDIHNPEDEDQ
ncbi:MAG TPA: TrkA family potassium uptake protein [Actinomycetota bacterium]|nr:TrkA family potassium uptake protein [Actinomycetota bacterium]